MKWLLILALFIACNDTTTTTTETSAGMEQDDDKAADPAAPSPGQDTAPSPTPGPSPAPAPGDQCYLRVTGRDSLRLSYSVNGNTITGKMMYDNYQKDGSWGTLKGTLHGDTLKIWYDFESEGMKSVRRIIYKIDGNKLYPGIGEFVMRGDSSLYADEKKIVFGEEGSLRSTTCESLKFTF